MTAAHLIAAAGGWSLWRTAALRGAGLPFGLLESLAAPSDDDAEIRAGSAEAVDALFLNDTFRTALTWQNPALMRAWGAGYAAALRRGERLRLSRRDRREALVARYAQRYCAKNDTVGFFGPVAWARFTDDGPDLVCRGSTDVRARSVHLEAWAVAALAEAMRRDPELLPHLPVRLDPASTFRDGVLRRANRRPHRVDAPGAAILAAVDGRRSVHEVSAAAARALPGEVSPADVLPVLLELDRKGVVHIGLTVPIDAHPEEHLRRQIGASPALSRRPGPLTTLDELDRVGRDAARAGPDRLAAVLDRGDRVLADAVGGAAERVRDRRASPYGRTPFYLDCRRDLDIELGPGALARLAEPLALLLDGARWLAAEVAEAAHRELAAQYAVLRARGDEPTLGELQFAAAGVLSGAGGWTGEIVEDFQLRWAEIVPETDGAEVRVSSATARPMVRTLFAAGPPRWAAARQHSPDLMLMRTADGGVRWVLGELHIALNTLESRVFVTQADEPKTLIDATAADFRSGRIVPVYPSTAPEATSRTYPPLSLDPPGLYRYWSYGSDQGHPSGAPSVPAAALRVTERDGRLIARHDSGGWEASVLEFFGEFLTALTVNLFQLRGPRPHAPRVLIDDLVVCRETWRFEAGSVPSPRRAADYRHRAIRQWARAHGLPRRVFARTPSEPKPFYVDFASPLLMENLARAVRREPATAAVQIVEMMPGPEDLWLTDPSGGRYTTEFRVVAVDSQEPGGEVWTPFPAPIGGDEIGGDE